MMESLISVGDRTITLEELKEKLTNFNGEPLTHTAPSSGLNLFKTTF